MQFDDLRYVCPIHFHRLFLISSSAASWNAALALPILAFTSASDPPCLSMMLLNYVKDYTSSGVCMLRPTAADGPPRCLVPVWLRHRIELYYSDCSVKVYTMSGSPVKRD
ncbi:unnamed protein product [Schistosoma curassoni]|uniref:Secreted protein n=1 Tax=Schistosoma curassoni TaxID=6186 RepID=A0A183KL43_9TREM|nr:unnamed protein product [Schistosoma curassoni]